MKIDQSGYINAPGGVQKQGNAQKPVGTGFADILNKVGNPQASQANAQTASANQINSMSPLSPLFKVGTQPDYSSIRQQGMDQLDNLLSSLEMYVNALKNDAVGKDRLKPLLGELVNQKDQLLDTVSKLPKDDNLRTLVDGALYAVTQEAINFQSYDN